MLLAGVSDGAPGPSAPKAELLGGGGAAAGIFSICIVDCAFSFTESKKNKKIEAGIIEYFILVYNF